jgi:hypothetical protein
MQKVCDERGENQTPETLRNESEAKECCLPLLFIRDADQLHTFSLSQLPQTIMLASNTCRFLLFSFLSLPASAETVRGAHCELAEVKVNLLTAGDFTILAETGITTTGVTSITGHIGVSTIITTAMTDFDLVMDTNNEYSTTTKVVGGGNVCAPDYIGNALATPTKLTIAVNDMLTAYTDAKGRPNSNAARINLGAGILGGGVPGSAGTSEAPLMPGVYTFSTGVSLTGSPVTSTSAVMASTSSSFFKRALSTNCSW